MKKIKNFKLKIIIIFLIIILFFNIYFILKESGIIQRKIANTHEEFIIPDTCSVIAGKIIHTVNTEGECENRCLAQCETFSLRYSKSEFELGQQTCHSCKCYCD
jgi:hypothetical protein